MYIVHTISALYIRAHTHTHIRTGMYINILPHSRSWLYFMLKIRLPKQGGCKLYYNYNTVEYSYNFKYQLAAVDMSWPTQNNFDCRYKTIDTAKTHLPCDLRVALSSSDSSEQPASPGNENEVSAWEYLDINSNAAVNQSSKQNQYLV